MPAWLLGRDGAKENEDMDKTTLKTAALGQTGLQITPLG
jgi:hypothetical protein